MGPKPDKKIAMLTLFYEPEPNFITADIAEHLAKSRKVTVITAHPNYPFGRFYWGTRFWKPKKSVAGGLTVWRLPFLPDHSRSCLKRTLSYLSFTFVASLFAPFIGSPKIVFIYQTPFCMGLVSLWFKWICQSKVIFICADIWPEELLAARVIGHGRFYELFKRYRRWLNRRADLIVCTTKAMRDVFLEEGISREATCYIPLWPSGIPETLAESALAASGEEVVYAGNLGKSQSVETIIRAAHLLKEKGLGTRFAIYGSGTEETRLRAMCDSLGLDNVSFMGRISTEEAYQKCRDSLAQVVLLNKDELFQLQMPSKLIYSFAAGAPILAGLEGESARACAESGGAVLFDSDNPNTLVLAIEALLSKSEQELRSMRRSMRAFYEEHFSKTRQLGKYEAAVRSFL